MSLFTDRKLSRWICPHKEDVLPAPRFNLYPLGTEFQKSRPLTGTDKLISKSRFNELESSEATIHFANQAYSHRLGNPIPFQKQRHVIGVFTVAIKSLTDMDDGKPHGLIKLNGGQIGLSDIQIDFFDFFLHG